MSQTGVPLRILPQPEAHQRRVIAGERDRFERVRMELKFAVISDDASASLVRSERMFDASSHPTTDQIFEAVADERIQNELGAPAHHAQEPRGTQ